MRLWLAAAGAVVCLRFDRNQSSFQLKLRACFLIEEECGVVVGLQVGGRDLGCDSRV